MAVRIVRDESRFGTVSVTVNVWLQRVKTLKTFTISITWFTSLPPAFMATTTDPVPTYERYTLLTSNS
jgi:hypothetical protein